MKVTRDRNPEALKRFAHLTPARWGAPRCGRRLQGTGRACTLVRDHRGLHAAHGRFGRLMAVWGPGDGSPGRPASGGRGAKRGRGKDPSPSASSRRLPSAARPVGLRSRRALSLSARIRAVGSWMGDHMEEILLLTFFGAFVWFAIDWLMIIFR